jgi:hypothetical protein
MYASNVVRSLRDQSFARTLRIAGTSQRYYGLQALHKDTTDCRHFTKILRIAGSAFSKILQMLAATFRKSFRVLAVPFRRFLIADIF